MIKSIKFYLLIVSTVFTFSKCSQREVGLQNVEIRVQIFDSITKSPVSNAEVSIKQIEKTCVVSYFNQVHFLEEKITDQNGYVNFNIDSLGEYLLRIKYRNFPFSTCSKDINLSKINFNEEIIIKCSDPNQDEKK